MIFRSLTSLSKPQQTQKKGGIQQQIRKEKDACQPKPTQPKILFDKNLTLLASQSDGLLKEFFLDIF